MRIKIILVSILFAGITFAGLSQSRENKNPSRVHFIGNSYTYFQNLPQVLAIMAQSRGVNMVTTKSTFGGAELLEHWNNGSADKPSWNLDTKKVLKNENFDYVILQEQSMNPIINPDSTLKYVGLFCDLIKKQGAKPYLYLTWGRERIPQMQEGLNKTYMKAAIENDVEIVPVGMAWELARQLRPNIKLFAEDGTHPSYLGAYLSACTFFTKLTGESPIGLPHIISMNDEFGESLQLMKLNNEDALFLQTVAQNAVSEWDNND